MATDFTEMGDVRPAIFWYYDATIANGAALSDAIDLGRFAPVALVLPAAWTSAVLSFAVSTDGTTFDKYLVTQPDGEVDSASANAADQYVVLDPSIFFGVLYFKIRSGTVGSPVNQAAARTVRVIVRGL